MGNLSEFLMEELNVATAFTIPIFGGIEVAESTVIFAPILQLGCLSACAGVMFFSSSFVQPQKGPPEAVRISFFRAFSSGQPCRH